MAKSISKPKHLQDSVIKKAKQSLEINHDEFVKFSFKYFLEVPGKFEISSKESDYFIILIDRLKALSSFKVMEFYANRSNALRCHPIDWKDTSEDSFCLKNEEQLVETPYQFELSANEYGRIHGFLIDSTFYIRWFDPEHKLYS
ncbi:hypothetical protein [Lacinutrix sp. MEBiC02595]